MAALRRKTILRTIKDKTGDAVQLNEGDGYFYFSGKNVDPDKDPVVRVNRINDITLNQWLNEYRQVRKGSAAEKTVETVSAIPVEDVEELRSAAQEVVQSWATVNRRDLPKAMNKSVMKLLQALAEGQEE